MAITVSDVKDGFSTTVPDDEITALITFVDGADTCLTANSVPANTQDLLKLYAVRHMLAMQANSGQGEVRSESAPSGASRSYNSWSGGKDLNATRFGNLLKQIDLNGCVTNLLENTGNLSFMSVGPKRTRG